MTTAAGCYYEVSCSMLTIKMPILNRAQRTFIFVERQIDKGKASPQQQKFGTVKMESMTEKITAQIRIDCLSEREVRCLSELNQSAGVYFDVRVICGCWVRIILMSELRWIKIFSGETRSSSQPGPIGSFKLTLASNIFALGIFLNCFRAIKHNKLLDNKNSCSMSQ